MPRPKTVKAQLREALDNLAKVDLERVKLLTAIRDAEQQLGLVKVERDSFRRLSEILTSAARTAKERLCSVCNNTSNNETIRLALLYITTELNAAIPKG